MTAFLSFRLLSLVACGLFLLSCLPAQAAAPRESATCSWDRPGHQPFMGDVVAAVDHYPELPADVRARLKARMATRSYDDMVTIRRDSIDGREAYDNTIRGMHFGGNRMCGNVTRTQWTAAMQERGLVYCDSGVCILVPTICRNVSLITRRPASAAAPAGSTVAAGPEGELMFEPPGAGPLADTSGGNLVPPVAGPGTVTDGAPPSGSFADGGGGPGFFLPYVPGFGAGGGGGSVIVPTPAVPEPGTWALMVVGIAALALVRRRRGRSCCR